MNIILPARKQSLKCVALLILAAVAPGLSPAAAQETGGNLKVTYLKLIRKPGNIRLEGDAQNPARAQSPQFDVSAGVVSIDFVEDQKTKQNTITQVRALPPSGGRVNLRLDLPAPNTNRGSTGGTGRAGQRRMAVNCGQATYNPPTKVLVLTGKVDGFYEFENGSRTDMSGEQVNARLNNNLLKADIDGGARGVRVVLPSELFQPVNNASTTAGARPRTTGRTPALSVGEVVVTSRNAALDESESRLVARFIGNAHALSSGNTARGNTLPDGEQGFDITAGEFVLTRPKTQGASDTLHTVGRTHLKINLPAEPATSPPRPATTQGGNNASRMNIGQPTRVEADSDKLTISRANEGGSNIRNRASGIFTMVFEGNVTGFYELSGPPSVAGQPRPQLPFSGERATLRYLSEATADLQPGLHVEVNGLPDKPSEIFLPGFDLGF